MLTDLADGRAPKGFLPTSGVFFVWILSLMSAQLGFFILNPPSLENGRLVFSDGNIEQTIIAVFAVVMAVIYGFAYYLTGRKYFNEDGKIAIQHEFRAKIRRALAYLAVLIGFVLIVLAFVSLALSWGGWKALCFLCSAGFAVVVAGFFIWPHVVQDMMPKTKKTETGDEPPEEN